MYSTSKLALMAALKESKTKDDLYTDLAKYLRDFTKEDLDSFYADLAANAEGLACLSRLGLSAADLKAYVAANIVKNFL